MVDARKIFINEGVKIAGGFSPGLVERKRLTVFFLLFMVVAFFTAANTHKMG